MPSLRVDCPLCLDFYSDSPGEDYFVSTKCKPKLDGLHNIGHIFHYRCLVKGVSPKSKRFKCPMCSSENDFSQTLTRLHDIQILGKPGATVFDYEFKLVTLGKFKAGKTSIIRRFVKNEFSEEHNYTRGFDYVSKSIQMGDRRIRLHLYDTAGQEKYRSIVATYVRNAFGMIFVYDITDRTTFDALEDCIRFANENGPKETRRILVGNKLDLNNDREVTTEEGQEIAQKFGYSFFEVSAKEATNIAAIFKTLTTAMMDEPRILQAAQDVSDAARLREEVSKLSFIEFLKLKCC